MKVHREREPTSLTAELDGQRVDREPGRSIAAALEEPTHAPTHHPADEEAADGPLRREVGTEARFERRPGVFARATITNQRRRTALLVIPCSDQVRLGGEEEAVEPGAEKPKRRAASERDERAPRGVGARHPPRRQAWRDVEREAQSLSR